MQKENEVDYWLCLFQSLKESLWIIHFSFSYALQCLIYDMEWNI